MWFLTLVLHNTVCRDECVWEYWQDDGVPQRIMKGLHEWADTHSVA